MLILLGKKSEDVARIVAGIIRDRIKIKPDLVLGLATGSTPIGVYKELIRLHKEEGLDFSKVITFNLDEYLGLRKSHEQSYYTFMWDNLFKHININPSNVYIPQGDFDGRTDEYDPVIASWCEWYENKIASYGGVDIQLLGIGSDGHIAFNEPGSSLSSRTRVTTLFQRTISDNARFFNNDLKLVPTKAVTMGVGTILDAKEIILMATGAGKSEAVKASIEGPITSMCPASVVQWHQHAYICLDEGASSLLSDMAKNLIRSLAPAPPNYSTLSKHKHCLK